MYVARPKLAPCTVTLADPVAAAFARSITLRPAVSTEYAADTLPSCCPVVTETRKVPFTICDAWHRVDVSDSHVVRSHAVWPILIDSVYVAEPMFAPCTVTLADPVDRPFACLSTLKAGRSAE